MTFTTPGLDALVTIALGSDHEDEDLTDADFVTMVRMGINILRVTRLSYAISLETGNAALDALIKDAEMMLANAIEQLGIDTDAG